MSKRIDIKEGDRFGQLTIIKEAQPYLNKNAKYSRRVLAKCDCGNEKIFFLSALRSGDTKSCGCYWLKLTKLDINNGDKFGRLTIINELEPVIQPSGTLNRKFNCKCECGNYTEVLLSNLNNGHTKSCGCYGKEMASKARKIHGESTINSPEYKCWSGIKTRCFNEKHNSYKYWGGRGITMCDRWRYSFPNFLEDMGRKPGPEYSIDRIDVNGNYEPGNCRWATSSQQRYNQRPRQKKNP